MKIHGVGALMKVSGYRSAKNYISLAKKRHIELGYDWNAQLDLAYSRFNTSTRRGMGPPRQSEPLNYELVAVLPFGDDPVVPHGPLGTDNLKVLCTLFLCRELEASTALRRNVRINTQSQTVTWRLPASTRPTRVRCGKVLGLYLLGVR